MRRRMEQFQSTRPRGARRSGGGRGRCTSSGFNPRARVGRDLLIHAAPPASRCFNPRARVGRDVMLQPPRADLRSFNPRARVGRDEAARCSTTYLARFNPRARVGRDRRLDAPRRIWRVSIHAPAWGATICECGLSKAALQFQSTRPRGARRSRRGQCQWSSSVSIHAPAWGATRAPDGQADGAHVSIHAPAWGATPFCCVLGVEVDVSIHAPAWGATASAVGRFFCAQVSIHAPAWGATEGPGRLDRAVIVSIHAPAWGATVLDNFDIEQIVFQSTRPRGARLHRIHGNAGSPRFNPRARVGRDVTLPIMRSAPSVSIHAPAWGATVLQLALTKRQAYVSIHAPAWGATRPRRHNRRRPSGFNPRARVGRDPMFVAAFDAAVTTFQSTRPRGARPSNSSSAGSAAVFQSTRPRGARPFARAGRIRGAVFQSTRPRGARPASSASFSAQAAFQSTRPRGARRLRLGSVDALLLFQSTRPRGARPRVYNPLC